MSRRAALIGVVVAMGAAGSASAMTVASKAFGSGAVIPTANAYTRCGGVNASPELHWSAPPKGTRSLVLTVIDSDAQPPLMWSHWLVVDLPVATRGLPANTVRLPAPARSIQSNFGDEAYDGPCPPTGSGVHHYHFAIWAMPTDRTTLAPDGSAAEVLKQLSKTALASGELVGTVQR